MLPAQLTIPSTGPKAATACSSSSIFAASSGRVGTPSSEPERRQLLLRPAHQDGVSSLSPHASCHRRADAARSANHHHARAIKTHLQVPLSLRELESTRSASRWMPSSMPRKTK